MKTIIESIIIEKVKQAQIEPLKALSLLSYVNRHTEEELKDIIGEDYAPVRKTVHSVVAYPFGGITVRSIRMLWDQCVGSCGALAINSPRRQLCLYTCKEKVLKEKIRRYELKGKSASELKKKLARVESILNKYKEGAKRHGVDPNVDVKPYSYSPYKIPR